MYQSYFNLSNGRPVEYGIVEVFTKEGQLIDTTGLIEGYDGGVWLPIENMIRRNAGRAKNIGLIRVKHTHPVPQNLAADVSQSFSDKDISNDRDMRGILDSEKRLSHIKYESYIVYFRPEFVFNHSFNPLQVLGSEQFVRENNVVEVVGHRPR